MPLRSVLAASAVLAGLLAVSAADAVALEIRLEKKTTYAAQEFVNIHLTANKGLATIENGIEGKSFTENHQGLQTIALGVIPKPGIYTVRATQGGESQSIVFVALPEKSGRWELSPISVACFKDPQKPLLEKFAKAAHDKQITADEAALLRNMLEVAKAAATAKKIVAADGLLAKSLDAVPAVAEAVITGDAGNLLVKFSTDETKKVMLLIDLTKR